MSKKKIIIGILVTALLSSCLTVAGLCFALGINFKQAGDIARFFGVKHFIEARYVNEVDDSQLMDGAISGMVQSLGDPHSIYLQADMYQELKAHTEGEFGGIGVTMGFKDNKVTIISVLPDTPGEKAGLKAGDEILAVDGTPVSEMQSEEVAMHIRGEVGTHVTLTISRDGSESDYDIERATIKIETAKGKMLADGMGYIRIASFSENTDKEFEAAYKELEAQGMKGLIIDLRENPGGLVTSCVNIANMVVPKGPIVSVVERDGSKEVHESKLEEEKYPIVVLIDGNSASASEILAGALQDTGAATIVGTKSYGKGSVQVVMPMFHKDALKLTIAKYYTPNGRCIDGIGIEPDVEVDFQPGDTTDVQLEKAEEVLRQKMQ
ncbi:S41 family peptidase [Mitsuokella sp.]|uniref:S41 family peptidase n=1 Tax=Mitsuokella TaxID=52225 RepID=UPI0029E4B29D|nr:S41 family peptidase [Mitsuokella sp.]MDD6383522.1 S41 family peptidase [Selenomonadaceae bacterium]MDY4475018.1 S41 family peptidase [Mitsuokella sp.]